MLKLSSGNMEYVTRPLSPLSRSTALTTSTFTPALVSSSTDTCTRVTHSLSHLHWSAQPPTPVQVSHTHCHSCTGQLVNGHLYKCHTLTVTPAPVSSSTDTCTRVTRSLSHLHWSAHPPTPVQVSHARCHICTGQLSDRHLYTCHTLTVTPALVSSATDTCTSVTRSLSHLHWSAQPLTPVHMSHARCHTCTGQLSH